MAVVETSPAMKEEQTDDVCIRFPGVLIFNGSLLSATCGKAGGLKAAKPPYLLV
jgi:hypothetical protein